MLEALKRRRLVRPGGVRGRLQGLGLGFGLWGFGLGCGI